MLEIKNKHERCTICKKEYTSIHTEAMPGVKIYVCSACLESAKKNFIWICINCGRVYVRPKKTVIARLKDIELKKAYILCENEQIIQGIDMCIKCDPEGIMKYMDAKNMATC